MTKILTVTFNPALDLATSAACVEPNRKLRCAPETAEAGGGGVNVARAVTQLGGKAQALVALGGPNGAALGGILDAMQLDWCRVEAPGDTRHSFSVTDESRGDQYRFVLTGPVWTSEQLDAVLNQIAETTAEDTLIVFSGSMPPGAQVGFLSEAAARLLPRRVIIDTSGPHLESAAKGEAPAPFILRMDSHEARELSGLPLESKKDSADFAETLRQRGAAECVVIARGADGSVMAAPDGLWHVNAANDNVVSAIGAGDSFVGGMVMGLANGERPEQALRMGAAAASAAVLSKGTQLCLPADYARMLPVTHLTQL
ncbi:1-phosphofructokinase family hexose kinase [Pacificoceanicola onchidii]|uniref:1-phosphofructokinase family hexose kinase n=1 Tax=Pacificoceanicola onchidii TaxID=2562685 RepID=UPI0010A6B0BF|nr:1-phosphofructokinase family hexose kinase [Pacificoceanicola onchidii]